jgi:hypothetical protein
MPGPLYSANAGSPFAVDKDFYAKQAIRNSGGSAGHLPADWSGDLSDF